MGGVTPRNDPPSAPRRCLPMPKSTAPNKIPPGSQEYICTSNRRSLLPLLQRKHAGAPNHQKCHFSAKNGTWEEKVGRATGKKGTLVGENGTIQKKGVRRTGNFLITVTFLVSLPYEAPPRPRRNHWCGLQKFCSHINSRRSHGTRGYVQLLPHKSGARFPPDFPSARTNGFYGGAGVPHMVNLREKLR